MGLEHGIFVLKWTDALSRFPNLHFVEIAATDQSNEFMSARKPVPPPLAGFGWYNSPRARYWEFMRRIYPTFLTPFAAPDSVDDLEEWNDDTCVTIVSSALQVMADKRTPSVKCLKIVNMLTKLEDVDWSDFSSALHRLVYLELQGVWRYPSDAGKGSVSTIAEMLSYCTNLKALHCIAEEDHIWGRTSGPGSIQR